MFNLKNHRLNARIKLLLRKRSAVTYFSSLPVLKNIIKSGHLSAREMAVVWFIVAN
ncbi:hypothetical protein SEEH0134_15462 [Salmonella enterica subsp. enterica serovar Heidelberg str. N20134]|uniref:Uncharacterized protein n=2 Tax=Salmonella enterica I TaxID=59201 RepID=A0A6C8H015_SALET|nr:conserved hypothetical protein [Salmonella enterica subsp. enterica serovar Heidelberg str. SL476]AGQ61795.1 hypothetical protein SEEH1578_00930 [Salmonella enterica subsp. enterica serovar Heidelberg str. 41578]EDZ24964.1 conserved hypothetical protein [Salmonella enterica subsp. enterica serovar Heidelberg str. SL486]EHC88283.1 hypothetical protein LTSEUGA_4181 [Salmonella enterica subsp. enterica serovar Uganda str. R8-3404]EIC31943.1 hypothetical protein SEEH1579_15634 [Salmonella enteri